MEEGGEGKDIRLKKMDMGVEKTDWSIKEIWEGTKDMGRTVWK